MRLALWNFLPLCCWRLLSVLLRTFFEFFCFFFFFERMLVFFDRTLYMSLSMHWGTCSAQTPTEKDSCGDQCAAQTDSHSAYNIFSAPQSSDGLGRRISGKAPRHRGGFTRKHDRRARTANSLASWTDKDVCQRPCAITFSPHRRCPL